jgi:hypothetical protein
LRATTYTPARRASVLACSRKGNKRGRLFYGQADHGGSLCWHRD